MSRLTIKILRLHRDQLLLIHAMVKVTEKNETFRHALHNNVARKVECAKNNVRQGVSLVSFSTEERHLLRDYNTTYCANLACALLEAETNYKSPVTPTEALCIYRMATQIHQLLR